MSSKNARRPLEVTSTTPGNPACTPCSVKRLANGTVGWIGVSERTEHDTGWGC